MSIASIDFVRQSSSVFTWVFDDGHSVVLDGEPNCSLRDALASALRMLPPSDQPIDIYYRGIHAGTYAVRDLFDAPLAATEHEILCAYAQRTTDDPE